MVVLGECSQEMLGERMIPRLPMSNWEKANWWLLPKPIFLAPVESLDGWLAGFGWPPKEVWPWQPIRA